MKLIVSQIIRNTAAHSFIRNCACIFLLLISQAAIAQEFTLTVTKTDETCQGNGSLNFSIENADPGSPVTYKVYLLPNTTTPISSNTNPAIQALEAGTYLIIASQTVNGTTVTSSQEITIDDLVVPLQYNVSSTNALCGNDGSITANVTSGTAVAYEILSGPVTVPPQASNVFSMLPAGTYQIRVTDNCGSGIVITHTMYTDGPVVAISGPSFPDSMLPACDMLTAAHSLLPGTSVPIAFPLQIRYTVYPPDGSPPIIYDQTIWGSATPAVKVEQVIPFYYGVDYYYDFEVTDPCGVVYTQTNNLVDVLFSVTGGFDKAGCDGKFLLVDVTKYMPPYQITFISYPAGFDPETFNPAHPGPFTGPSTAYGNVDMPVPLGDYVISVTDGCNRTDTDTVTIDVSETDPTISVVPGNCANPLGSVQIEVPGVVIVSAMVDEAPDEYENPLPDDVTGFVTAEDGLMLEGIPSGNYLITLTDDCGIEYIAEFEVLAYNASSLNPFTRPDCSPGKSTVNIVSLSPPLSALIITAAPPEFTETLPYDASLNINNGAFYMDNLPPGSYTFTGADACSSTITATRTLTAYAVTENEFEKIPHCGSFDLDVHHSSNGVAFFGLWLQKELSPGVWGHPGTGVVYSEGTMPEEANSIKLVNNTLTPNYEYTGTFRVVKYFQAFGNGSSGQTAKDCIEIVYEFDFYDDLTILEVVSLTCSGSVSDIEVNVDGALPLSYKIVEKNGDPFFIDNGTSNVFTGLESASYLVVVSDLCGHTEPQFFNVADLPSLVSANTPPDMQKCDEGDDGTEEFDLTTQNDEIIGTQDAGIIAVTYHTSQTDAEVGLNPITLPESHLSGNSTVYARLVYNNISACYAVASFGLVVHPNPILSMPDEYTVCDGAAVTITANAGFVDYLWSTNSESQSISVTDAGDYTVTVTDAHGCEASKTVTVAVSGTPVITHIETTDWTDNNNTITVVAESSFPANFLYSLDGINYQASNTFYGVAAGRHTIYVKDDLECGLTDADIYLLTYPKFFTPNGDGINEMWRIKFSIAEPDMLIYIFDRFGKVVASFDANSNGWDGTFNGSRLPATDYWFVVKRQNGKEMKGHFAMVR